MQVFQALKDDSGRSTRRSAGQESSRSRHSIHNTKSPISKMRWTEKPEFLGIDLNDSFVLSWGIADERLVFELEASIWPDSQYYEAPLPENYTCYRRAQLAFAGFKDVDGLKSMEQTNSSIDPDGSRDYGNIDELEQTEKGYRISGDFGSVAIEGGTMSFTVEAG